MGCHSPAYWVGKARVCSSRGRLSNSNPWLILGPIKYLKRRGFAFAYAMSSFNDKPGLRPGINLSNAHTYNSTLCEQRWHSVESTPSQQCRLRLSSSVDTGMSLLLNIFSAPSGFFWALRFCHLLKHQHVQNSSSVWAMYFNNWINLKGHKFISYLNCWVSPALNDG